MFRSLSFDASRSRGERRIKRGMAVRPSPASVAPIPVHSACRTPPGSRPPRTDAACAARPVRRRRLLRNLELRALGADPLHRASRTRTRLEEPPKPSQPLSVAVAPGAPVHAVPSPRRQLAPRAVRPVSHSPSGPELQLRLWFREARPPARTPFLRIGSRALAALGLPESPSPHPSGCDPDEACARNVSPALRLRG